MEGINAVYRVEHMSSTAISLRKEKENVKATVGLSKNMRRKKVEADNCGLRCDGIAGLINQASKAATT